MARIFAQKHLNSLRPVDEAGADVLRKIKQGDIVTVDVKKPRNVKHHRMFFALMNLVYENTEREVYPTLEDVIGAVKIAAGLRTRIALRGGEIGYMPGSISFSKMDQHAFSEFYDRVCDLVAQHFLPGIDQDDLRAEVETMIGINSNYGGPNA